MKKIFSIILILSLIIVSNPIIAQITGGGDNAPGASEAKAATTGGNALSSNVNLLNGTLQTSYSLGSVSTPTGLTYNQTLSYSSTYATGDNTPFMSGIPYGEGWNLNIPSITVKTASKHKYTPDQHETFERSTLPDPSTVQGITFDLNDAKEESDIEYFSPEINIPGVASGRLIFKGFTYARNVTSVKEAVFILHDFSGTYIEVTLREDNSWEANLPDGSVYVFAERKQVIINAANQRFEDNVNVDAILKTRAPNKITTTWFVSYIEAPAQHHNYRIVFNYKKLGEFDFHKEQIYFYSGAGEPMHGQLSTTSVYRDIFLENVSAVYRDENSIAQVDINGVPKYAIIEFEKLDFLYKEDLSIRKPTGMTSLPGILFTGPSNVEVVDDLYNRTIIYDAKVNQNSKFTDWRRYEHIRRDQSSSDAFASKINPFLTAKNIGSTGIKNYYKRRATAGSLGIGSIPFDHSFIESPKIDIQKTSDVSNMPPGDIYEIVTEISDHDNYYCNFDINIVTGATGADETPNPALSTTQPDYYLEDDYNSARHTNVFTTFGNQNKWNPYFNFSTSPLVTSNFFVMPNLPNGFEGLFVQIGPGNSDNIFNIYQSSFNQGSSYIKVLESTYPQENFYAEGSSPYWVHRQTSTIPHNFGGGFPWYNEHRVLKNKYGTGANKDFPDGSRNGKIDKIYSNWFQESGISGPHQPTLANQVGSDPKLKELKIYRYSKKPYVLKHVKHYKLKGDGTGDNKSEMYQDGIIELKYAYVQAAAYENIVENYDQQLTPSAVEVSKRYIITLVQIEDGSALVTEKKTAVNFDYQLTTPENKQEQIQDYNTSFYAYTSTGENVVLTRVTDPLGKQKFISYYDLSDDETTRIKLGHNKYRYYPDTKKAWDPGSINNITVYMAPSQVFKFNRAVKEIKTEIANASVSNNQISVQTYLYDPSGTNNFKTNVEPEIPLYSSSDPGTYNYRAHSSRKELHGFVNVKVQYKSSLLGSVEKTISTEHHFEHHLWGKVKKVSTYSGANTTTNDLLSEDIFTYEIVKAFENGLKRPGYAGLHFDYHDYWEDDGLIIPGSTLPPPTGYYNTEFNISPSDVGSVETRLNKLAFQPTIIQNNTTFPSRDERTPQVNYLINYSNYSTVQSENAEYLDANFVKLTKKESKLYDLTPTSTKNTTTVSEYDYFDADYKGKSTSKGYDYILKTASTVSTPHRLLFIPSWMPYSTTTYSLEAPDKKSINESFYYYDLKNEYSCFSDGFEDLPPFYSTNHGSNFLASKGVIDFTLNGLAALSYSNLYGIRNIMMEKRVQGFKTNNANHIHSTYYLYEVVDDANDFNLKTAPFTFSNETYTPPTGTPSGTPPTYTDNPKPGVSIPNTSGNGYNPNTWGSTDPTQMGPPPNIDPTIVVINNNSTGISDWFSHPINPQTSQDLVLTVYNETNITAGEKIHSYLTALNGQISVSLDEYLKTTHPQIVLSSLITGYNSNNQQHSLLGNFMLRGVNMINNELKKDSIPTPLGNYLDSVDKDSMDVIVYSSEYNDYYNIPDPSLTLTTRDVFTDALRLSKVVIQIDDVITADFTTHNPNYNTTTLPPILQFRHYTPPIGNQTNYHKFLTVFPYKTLTTKTVKKLNYLGGIEEEEDQNGLITKNELFEQKLIYLRENTGSVPSPDTRKVMGIKLITQPIGAIQTSTVGYGQTGQLVTTYSYYGHGLIKKITHPNNNTEEFEYDELLRPYKTIKDGKTIAITKYSSFPVYSLYTNPDLLSSRSSNYALTSVNFETRALANYTETELVFDNTNLEHGSISRSFIDPLGRSFQSTSQNIVNGTTNPKTYDAYTYHSGKVEYNDRNLPFKSFKPFEISTGATSLSLSIKTNPASTPLFRETAYETSIQTRPLKVSDFGVSISSSQAAQTQYSWLNKTELSTELGLTPTEQSLLMPLYSTNSYIFFKTKGIDQDGKEVIAYTDAVGEKIATKGYSDASKTIPIVTLSINNSQGLTNKVINPEKQESIYQYNILGWKYEENTPDKGITRYIFNKSGQVTLMQDENARAGINNSNLPYYIENSYDLFSRLTKTRRVNVDYSNLLITSCGGVTGICAELAPLGHSAASTPTYSNFSENVCYDDAFTNSKTYDWEFATTQYYYGFCNDPTKVVAHISLDEFKEQDLAKEKLIVQNYYHTKPSLTDAHTESTNLSLLNTYNRLTASISYNSTGLPIQYKYFSYLNNGNIATELHQFNESGIDVGSEGRVVKIDYAYTYTDKLKNKNVLLQTSLSPSNPLAITKQYYYEYDGFNRLQNVFFNEGTLGGGSNGTKIASYTYNNVFGFVEKVNYFGFNNSGCKDLAVDEITYDRTTDDRNRLTKINSTFFDWEMYYDGNIPTQSNTGLTSPNIPGATANYNGNINFTIARYRLAASSFPSSPPNIGNPAGGNMFKGITAYGYTYDGLNRLTNADATVQDHILQGLNYPVCLQYGDASYTYDKIGNITNLTRYNNVNDPTTTPTISNLNMTYNYSTTSNRLNTITEANNNRNTTFTYDNNGNTTGDVFRNISAVTYNEGNLPYQLSANGKTVNYLYDESGFRLYKEVIASGTTTKEYYIKDATGNVIVILDLQSVQIQQWNIEGVAKAKPVTTGGEDLFFYIKDHLGNTRLTYNPFMCQNCGSGCSIYDYKFEHVIDYYPFGKVLREYNPNPYGKEKYLTTGNERDAETDWDYRNARFYDAEIGRFLAVDPLANEQPLWSSYVGLNNNPIYFIDPTGLFGEFSDCGPNGGPGWGGGNPASAMGTINETFRRFANDFVNLPIFNQSLSDGFREFSKNFTVGNTTYQNYEDHSRGFEARYNGWTLFNNSSLDGTGKLPRIPAPDISFGFFNNVTKVEKVSTKLNPNTTIAVTNKEFEDGSTSRTFTKQMSFGKSVRSMTISRSVTSHSNGDRVRSNQVTFGPSAANLFINVQQTNNNAATPIFGARFNFSTKLPPNTIGREYYFSGEISGGLRNR